MSNVVIHQPEYFPWVNLFLRMVKCDKFVFLDSVQYLRRSFQNRNIIGKDGNIVYITVPIKYAPRDTLIRDIVITAEEGKTYEITLFSKKDQLIPLEIT